MIKLSIALSLFIAILAPVGADAKRWWKQWNDFPKVEKITAREVKDIWLAGHKIIFVYTGDSVTEIVCGSFFIPHTKVPPRGDGSTIKVAFPKGQWIMCY
jgi:hypothetical protein